MNALLFHPKVVHLPMALSLLMPLVSGGLLLAWWRDWLPRRAWLLVIALQALLVGSGIVALRTGAAEEQVVERLVAEQFIDQHEAAAEIFVWTSGAILALMVLASAVRAHKTSLRTAAAGTLGTLLVLGLGYRTGQAGGKLVYQHGAAQAHAGPSPAAGAPGGTRRNDDD